MSKKISDLSEILGIELKELKQKLIDMGAEINSRSRVIDDDLFEKAKKKFGSIEKKQAKEQFKKAPLKTKVEKIKKSDLPKVPDLPKEKTLVEEVLEEDDNEEKDVSDLYESMLEMEREREIIKSQRKITAGKEDKSKYFEHKKEDKNSANKVIELPEQITIKEFAEKSGQSAAKIIGELMKNGILANINQFIDFDTAQIISDDLGIKVKKIHTVGMAEDFLSGDISALLKQDDADDLEDRPPVIVIMGHVDHGKTKLLDKIRHSDVVSTEAGGITQHIGAYQIEKDGRFITFLDTPGHEAFTAMRARGAKVTDIAVLVVAADEGVKPQTIEALNHAKDAGVPIIVAINKMDKPGASPDKVMMELAEQGLQPEKWGGNTIFVPISALTGQGVDELLEMILLTADMANLKANPNREAIGTVIESHLDPSLGPVATILVNSGTLKIMNNIVVGHSFGRIKILRDHRGNALRVAGPSTPVLIAGMHQVPQAGDILQVVKDEKTAKNKVSEILLMEYHKNQKASGVEQLITTIKSDKILKIILKGDTKGTIEAIRNSLSKIKDEEVAIKVIHSAVGPITESDVMMASAGNAIVIGFDVDYNTPNVKKLAERDKIEVRLYRIIYKLIEDVTMLLSGLIAPEQVEVILGRAKVRQVFFKKKNEMILGLGVINGKLVNKAKLKVFKAGKSSEETPDGLGEIKSLRKVDKEVKEINEGNDCGIKFVGDPIVEEGDILEAYIIEEKKRNL
ncbi:MAG: translation initiation factor IF-2 [Candidatus Gracilibacteria bacterium]|jgi:translation initiation factor IF-2|nr:translation initiation factor IF-2 [Candidatus Gracilibacteria bacterium]